MEASWAEVLNQYRRRADLVPNVVQTVKSYAEHEKEVLTQVTKLRAQTFQTNLNIENLNEESMAKFEKTQRNMGIHMRRLFGLHERYPDLKSNERYRDLQVQLEGTENRIAVARKRYIDTIKEFNNLVEVFPTSITNNLFFKHSKKPQFTVDNPEELEKAPKLDL